MENIIGKKLDGRYEIQEIIGVGGMAIVYKAYDSIDDRIVAVKVLKEEYLSNEDFKRRFKNESKAIAVLSHPNIVKVYDVSLGERLQYIVMEYVDGITLKEYIDQQHVLTWKEAVHFTVQILRALQHAHEKGIVHRDIKPQNIMMLEDGTIKVADFGIARFANSETRTMTDKAIGSVHYISPEQARGAETDEKSDIYSVGVMLYEMLTGVLPFESENAVSVAIMQMQKEPRRPREVNDQIPEGLEDITLRAMQKDPVLRYPTAADMLTDIDQFKRNPSIHFEYKYFVDESPTKYVDAINKIKGTQEKPEQKKPEKKAKKTSVIPILSAIAAGVLVLALGIVFWALWMLGLIGGGSNEIAVPNVVGKMYSSVSADKNVTKNFVVVKASTQTNDKPAGTILQQTPDGGEKAKPHSKLSVIVSGGPRMAEVTNVINKTQADATAALESDGFTVAVQTQSDPSIVKQNVIKTDPADGTKVPYGSTVTIYVSTGPSSVTIPGDIAGKSLGAATTELQGLGLVVSPNPVYRNDSSAPGNVIGISGYKSGDSVKAGTQLTLIVSNGPASSSSAPPPKSQSMTFNITGLASGKSYDIIVAIPSKQDNASGPYMTNGSGAISKITTDDYSGSQTVNITITGPVPNDNTGATATWTYSGTYDFSGSSLTAGLNISQFTKS